jgi:hypothetical protein
MKIDADVLKTIANLGNDSVKNAIKAVAPDLFMPEGPFLAVGKKSACLYLCLPAEDKKIRLNDGNGTWTKFKSAIGVKTNGGINIDDYDVVTGYKLIVK